MPFRSKKTDDTQTDLLTGEEPVVAHRLEWVTTATRDQLADMSARSKSLAGAARAKATPLAEIPGRRFRHEQVVVVPEPEEGKSSAPWLLIALVAAIASALVAIAVQRARQRTEDEFAADLMMEADVYKPEPPPIDQPYTYDELSTNPG